MVPTEGLIVHVTVEEKLVAENCCVPFKGTAAVDEVTVGVPPAGVGVGVGRAAVEDPPPPQPTAKINIAQPSTTAQILDIIMPGSFVMKLLRMNISEWRFIENFTPNSRALSRVDEPR